MRLQATTTTGKSAIFTGRRPARAASAANLTTENTVFTLVVVSLMIWMAFDSTFDSYTATVFTSFAAANLVFKWVLGPSLSFTNLTLPGIFFMAYFCLMSLASLYVYGEMELHAGHTYLLAVQSVLITFPAGILATNLFFANPNARITNYARSAIRVTPGDLRFAGIVYWVFRAAIVVSIIYLCTCEFIPILKVFVDYSDHIDDISLRFLVSETPRPLLLVFALSRSFALPLCVLYLYFMSHSGSRRFRSDFYITFGLSVMINTFTLERGPTIVLCGMLLFGTVIAHGGRLLEPRLMMKCALIMTIALTVAGLISAYQYSSDASVSDVVDGIEHIVFSRLTLTTAKVSAMAFEEFPGPDFLNGQYVRMFSILTGREYLESRYAPPLVILPVGFVADLWRNWGWPAVLLGGFVLGALFQAIQLALFRERTVISCVFQAILILACMWLIPGNAFGILTTSMLVSATALGYLAIRWSMCAPPLPTRLSLHQGRLHAQ